MNATFSFPTLVRLQEGVIRSLPEHLERMRLKKPLVVTDAGLEKTDAWRRFSEVGKGWPVFSGVQPNPELGDVEAAAAKYRENGCDSVIGIGGGSALDAAKALRLLIKRPNLSLKDFDFTLDWSGLPPFIAIPTTAGTGSEVGRSSVVTIHKKKHVIFHPALLASLVLLDPELTLLLPPKLTAATGADALTHCIESYTSPVYHPLCDGIALEGIRLVAEFLPRAVQEPHDLEARANMLVAAMMGGIAFQKDLGATHSLAHPLSSLAGMHHGLANALCLPAVMKFNAKRKPGLYKRIGQTIGLSDSSDNAVINYVSKLLTDIGIAGGLKAHNVSESLLESLTEQAWTDGCHQTNPVPVSKDDLRNLYLAAL